MNRPFAVIAIMGLLAGCDGSAEKANAVPSGEIVARSSISPGRSWDFTEIARGRELFQQNCAQCHGPSGEGAPNWQLRDADGMFPAPPLNGTGHAWHHPSKMLHHVIKNGSPGGGRMPAWEDKLSDDDIQAIIAWFQSQWPSEIYAAWVQTELRSTRAER